MNASVPGGLTVSAPMHVLQSIDFASVSDDLSRIMELFRGWHVFFQCVDYVGLHQETQKTEKSVIKRRYLIK